MASDNRNWDDEEESIINFVPKASSGDSFSPLPFPEDSLGLDAKPISPSQEENRGIRFSDTTSLTPPPRSAGFPPLPGRIPMGMPPLPTAVYSNSYASARKVPVELPPAESQADEPEMQPETTPEPSISKESAVEIKESAVEILEPAHPSAEEPILVQAISPQTPEEPPIQTPFEANATIEDLLPPSESLLSVPNKSKRKAKAEVYPVEALPPPELENIERAPGDAGSSMPEENDGYDPPTIMDVPLVHLHEMQRIAESNPVMQVPTLQPAVVELIAPTDLKTKNEERPAVLTPDSEHIPEVGMFVVMKTPTARIHHIFRIETAKMELGRSFDASIFIDDRAISMRHAAIRYEKNEDAFDFVLYDLASTNGTFVNGQRVSKLVLHDDDLIEIGESALAFKRVKMYVPKEKSP